MFTILEDAFVITRCNGVYRQAKVYLRRAKGGHYLLYAGHGSGFVSLYREGVTSVPKLRWEVEGTIGYPIYFDGLGRAYITK